MAKVVPFRDFKQRFIDFWNTSANGKEQWDDKVVFDVAEFMEQCGVEVFGNPPVTFCNKCCRLFIGTGDDEEIYCSEGCRERDEGKPNGN